MTGTNDYVYAVEFLRGDRALAAVGVTPDFAPAAEAARFAAFRRGAPPEVAFVADVQVKPSWHDTLGQPYIRGVRAAASVGSRGDAAVEIPLRYFAANASAVSATFVQQGMVAAGEALAYLVTAYPGEPNVRSPEPGHRLARADAEAAHAPGSLEIGEVQVALDVRSEALAARLAVASPVGAQDPVDVHVLVPEAVIEEGKALASVAEDVEVGGFLIGHLCRDTGADGDVFLEVTDLLPARHTRATVSTLTFTPDTWWDARAALSLRRHGESFLGWVHSHPVTAMCRRRGCSEDAQRHCPMAKDYFSEHDRFLHRTMFPRAHSVALVVNDWAFAPTSVSLFGYRHGLIEPRGFDLVPEAHRDPGT